MTETELKRIEDVFNATTSGRWEVSEETGVIINDENFPDNPRYVTDAIDYVKSDGDGEANAAFIVMAHETIPQLLAEVRRLRGLCDRIVADRIQDSDVALEAVRRERESFADRVRGVVAKMKSRAIEVNTRDISDRPVNAGGTRAFNEAATIVAAMLLEKP